MIHTGDCIEVMRTLPADSVDAVVTDPPYALTGIGRTLDLKVNLTRKDLGPNKRMVLGGFMGRSWDAPGDGTPAGFQAWCEAWGREALRVTKPGGYLLAFGGTRTHHRLVCGLEDAGWIIRDELDWIYASGFPKGRANLKPAHEPIVLARKPGLLRPLNIEESRIGYTSEADRPTQEEWNRAGSSGAPGANGYAGQFSKGMKDAYAEGKIPVPSGRWPSNLLLSDPELFDEPNPYVVGSGAVSVSTGGSGPASRDWVGPESDHPAARIHPATGGLGDSGGYSRFFKVPHRHDWWCEDDSGRCEEDAAGDDDGDFDAEPDPEHPTHFLVPKADRADREPIVRPEGHDAGKRFSTHPTVKPTDLMRHLVRLVTPSGGTVLDCFAGSGSTLIAAELEGFPWIGIEKEPEYVAIAEARLNGTQRGLGLDVPAPTSSYRPPKKMPKPKWTAETPGFTPNSHLEGEPAA